MSEQLKPCPFCGNTEPEFERVGTSRQSCIVVCGECGARHESSDEGEDSGASWNRRAQPAPITSETGNQAAQGASAITSAEVPMTEIERKAAKWDAINAVWMHKDAKLEDLVAAILRQRIETAMNGQANEQPNTAPSGPVPAFASNQTNQRS